MSYQLCIYDVYTDSVDKTVPKKHNTACSAKLHVLVYTLLYTKVLQQVVYTWFTVEKHVAWLSHVETKRSMS